LTPISYRALLSVPSFPTVVLSTLLSRVAGQMSSIALILFILTRYHSPALAGLATFLSIFPGVLVSPLAGALLDRHGRKRLIVIDYLFAMLAWVTIGTLSLAHQLPVPLLLVLTGLQAVTAPLSQTGLRTLFPLLVLDESGIPKRGRHSAGVGPQYCGRTGRVEYCQVGVFLSYVISLSFALVGSVLLVGTSQEMARRHIREEVEGVCRHCGYDLCGNVSGVCPECGMPVEGERLGDQKPRSGSHRKQKKES